jgi:hypothetical protein
VLFEELELCQTDLRWQVAHIESPYLPDFVRLSIGMQVGASYNILSEAFIFLDFFRMGALLSRMKVLV